MEVESQDFFFSFFLGSLIVDFTTESASNVNTPIQRIGDIVKKRY